MKTKAWCVVGALEQSSSVNLDESDRIERTGIRLDECTIVHAVWNFGFVQRFVTIRRHGERVPMLTFV
jgi:hypothetical protein